MHKIAIVLFLLFMTPRYIHAQVSPKEGAALNYRLIGFSFPAPTPGSKCSIEIADGSYFSEDSFAKSIIISQPCNNNKILGEVPRFGSQYTWRIVAVANDSTKTKSPLYHFSTRINPDVDTNNTRLRIIIKARKYKDAYIFLDGTRSLYDMNGNPVWFLPDIDGSPAGSLRISDLKLTPQGTITFMTDRKNGTIYEVNYDGKILWKAGDNNNVNDKNYHHEFTRLANGHYMTLGNEVALWELPSPIDSTLRNRSDIKDKLLDGGKNKLFQKIYLATVIEYDSKGHEIWKWKSSQYFKQGLDVYARTNANGIYQIDDPHLNSFFFDEHEKAVYLGFRDISRVLKIAYPRGEVLTTYGNPYINGTKDTSKDLFCWQHACRHSENGYIYMFNNNTCHHGSLPKITIIKDPPARGNSKKIWEYECPMDGVETKEQYQFANGGNVVELPGNEMFVNMSHELYTRVFIVDRNKTTLWSAIPERWNETKHTWSPVFQYRSSIITNKSELERLIWSSSNDQ